MFVAEEAREMTQEQIDKMPYCFYHKWMDEAEKHIQEAINIGNYCCSFEIKLNSLHHRDKQMIAFEYFIADLMNCSGYEVNVTEMQSHNNFYGSFPIMRVEISWEEKEDV